MKILGSIYPTLLTMLCLTGLAAAADLPADFPAITVTQCDTNAVGEGCIFLEVTDSSTNGGYYLMILGNDGKPVWRQSVPNHVYDFKMLPNGYLHYALFYNTHSWTGGGDVTHEILDGSRKPAGSITGGNNYAADAHDFQLLPNGHTLLQGYYRTRMDVSKYVVGGYPNALIAGTVIQELDAERNVVFQWRSWDHFTIPTYFPPTAFTNNAARNPVIDAFHVNTVVLDTDGNLLVSNFGMDVWKISRQTGEILWRLGGIANQFSFVGVNPLLARGHFSGHTVSRLENGHLLIYCNADQQATRSSKVYEYSLDESNKVATLVWSYTPPTNLYAWHYGSAQRLANGNTFIGWGGANIMAGIGGVTNQWIPACTEVAADGKVVFEMTFNDPKIASYRAYRMVYPPASQAREAMVSGLAAGNTFDFGSIGIALEILSGGGGYNEVTLTREPYAPVNPLFQSKAPLVLPLRVKASANALTTVGAKIYFDATSFGLTNPAQLTVYHRAQAGRGLFLPQPTDYNPVTKKLRATLTLTAQSGEFGEFIFGFPDLADVPYPPILAEVENYFGPQLSEIIGPKPATTGTVYPVNQELPIVLAWSPQGFARWYQLQISANPDFNSPAVDVPYQTEAFKVWSNAAPDTTYYYRVKTVNEGGESGWSAGAFQTMAPMIQVTVPNSGQAWQRGLTYFIQWNDNLAGQVVVDLYKSGQFLKSIATNSSPGACKWEAGFDLKPGADYTLRIRSLANPELFDFSDTAFAIDVPRITGLRPNPGGGWILEWTGSSAGAYVEFTPAFATNQWRTLGGPAGGPTWTNAPQSSPEGYYRLRPE